MLIGVFFSEIGTQLLALFSDHDPNLEQIRKELIVTGRWSNQDFIRAKKTLKSYSYHFDIEHCRLDELKQYILQKRDFLVGLLENPFMLEHETFTELLRAVFHLAEELTYREDLNQIPDNDRQHIGGDIKRAYVHLVHQWLDYMHYQKDHYPYLFSLAMRTNPFDTLASPVVKD